MSTLSIGLLRRQGAPAQVPRKQRGMLKGHICRRMRLSLSWGIPDDRGDLSQGRVKAPETPV
jgi:hypothetical protein